jgi:simple sugar transport system permease protein
VGNCGPHGELWDLVEKPVTGEKYEDGTIYEKQVVPLGSKILNSIVFVLLGLAFSSVLIIAVGFNPIAVYSKMVSYSFLNLRGISGSIKAALPLMFCGLSVSVAFRMNLNNIGAEGQYAIGALLGGGFALFAPEMPAPWGLLVMFLLCAAGGALWAMIAAALKAYWNVSETIITLMLNYIALLFMDYLCYGPWMAPKQTSAISGDNPASMFLPNMEIAGINSGIIVAIVFAVLLSAFYKYTVPGYQIGVIRNSIRSAEYGRINVKKNILLVMALSGAIAGLAGFVQIGHSSQGAGPAPRRKRLPGIVVAYLSQFNPIAVIIVSILLGGLKNSSAAVQIMGVPSQIATMLQGSIMIFVIAGEFFNRYRISINKGGIERNNKSRFNGSSNDRYNSQNNVRNNSGNHGINPGRTEGAAQ